MGKLLQQAELKQQLSNVAKKQSFLGTVPPALRMLPLAAFAVAEYVEKRHALPPGSTVTALLGPSQKNAIQLLDSQMSVDEASLAAKPQKARHPFCAVHRVNNVQCCLMSRLAGTEDQGSSEKILSLVLSSAHPGLPLLQSSVLLSPSRLVVRIGAGVEG